MIPQSKMSIQWMAVGLALLLAFVSGCVISPRRTAGGDGGGTPTPTPTPGAGGQLYVASGNSISRFSNAEGANGSTTPAVTITGVSSRLQNPRRLLLDTANDRLFVADSGSILVFDNASTLAANAVPSRVISGSQTGLSAPVDLALDFDTDELYVADGSSILVFANASTANNNTAPVRSFNLAVNIGAILLDTNNDQLFVADPADDIVDVLGNASLQNIIGQPTALIAGVDTGLSGPNGLALDASNRLIVSNSRPPVSLTVYPSASTANGDVLTVATIDGGSTQLTAPSQILLNQDVNNGELYVIDSASGSILVFSGLNVANGNIAPTRVITSTSLPVNSIAGMALDKTR